MDGYTSSRLNWNIIDHAALMAAHFANLPKAATISRPTTTIILQAAPVTPTFDPKIEANALYGKPMVLFSGGAARIGSASAPIVGPYIVGDRVSFMVSFGVPANPNGNRKIYAIYLDNELAWEAPAGGTFSGEGTFKSESFEFVFHQGRLDQPIDALETLHFPGDENAYRPQMLLSIRNIPWARFQANTGKPVPYVACDIGDTSDGADPADGINLGEALERVAYSPWAGYTTDTFESIGVTDVVDAILIKDNFTVVELCQSVTREYRNIDLLISDKVRVKDRGSNVSPNFLFNRNSIISDDEAVVVSRAGATEQSREHELIAIDPDQDYTAVPSLSQIPRNPMIISAAVGKETVTVPLVIDASTRQALATFSQNYQENARRKVALKAPASAYGLEPGDLFALTDIADGFDNEVFKCTQTTHGANWMVEIEGEAILRCSITGSDMTATWDLATATAVTLSGGDLIATNIGTSSADQGARVATASARSTGKYYFESTSIHFSGGGPHLGMGIGTTASTYANMGGSATTGVMHYFIDGNISANGADTGIGLSPNGTEGNVTGFAVDLDNRKIWFRKVAPVLTNWNNSGTADPETNTGGITIPAGTMVPFITFGGSHPSQPGTIGHVYAANFGASTFVGTVPSGFVSGWPRD